MYGLCRFLPGGLLLACAVLGGVAHGQTAPAPGGEAAQEAQIQQSVRVRRAAPMPSFEVSVTDGVFTPKTLEVPAHTRFKIELINHGPGPLEFENDEMNIEKVLGAGARSFVVLPPQPPGDIEFVDEFNPVSGVLVLHVR